MNVMSFWILAGDRVTQEQMLRSLRTGFRVEQSTHEAWAYILVGLGVIGLIGIGLQVWRRSARAVQQARRDHFRTAVELLQLRGEERALVLALRERAKPAEPVAMLLSPENLAFAVARAGFDRGDAQQLATADALSRRLFDRPLPSRAP